MHDIPHQVVAKYLYVPTTIALPNRTSQVSIQNQRHIKYECMHRYSVPTECCKKNMATLRGKYMVAGNCTNRTGWFSVQITHYEYAMSKVNCADLTLFEYSTLGLNEFVGRWNGKTI